MKEADIRPRELLQQYLDLSRQDGEQLDKRDFVEVSCPACGSEGNPVAIEKFGFQYENCLSCNTLYCTPRPNSQQLGQLYANSPSANYWSQVFFPAVAQSRREKLFAPKAAKIAALIHDRQLAHGRICDIGAGHGVFLEELGQHLPAAQLFAIEPDHNSAEVCRSKGIAVLEATVEASDDWRQRFDFVLSSEVIEHVGDPVLFAQKLQQLLKPGGSLLMTGLGYEGFDILTLGGGSQAVSPPHHLNFFSTAGFDALLKRVGFATVDLWTPGQLDLDIVLNSGHHSPFLEALKARGSQACQDFQAFLQKHALSSHVWVLAQVA